MANFLFVLSRDDNQCATRCFQFAQIAHSKGHGVNLFFIDDGVLWADSSRDFDSKLFPEYGPGRRTPFDRSCRRSESI